MSLCDLHSLIRQISSLLLSALANYHAPASCCLWLPVVLVEALLLFLFSFRFYQPLTILCFVCAPLSLHLSHACPLPPLWSFILARTLPSALRCAAALFLSTICVSCGQLRLAAVLAPVLALCLRLPWRLAAFVGARCCLNFCYLCQLKRYTFFPHFYRSNVAHDSCQLLYPTSHSFFFSFLLCTPVWFFNSLALTNCIALIAQVALELCQK